MPSSGQKGVYVNGLTELIEMMRKLPEDLWHEGAAIISRTAQAAYFEMALATPRRHTGNLRRGLILDMRDNGPGRPRAIVRNRAKHAWLWEHGSKGPRRGGTGIMPAAHQYIPAAMRHREQMRDQLVAMVERHGLKVTR